MRVTKQDLLLILPPFENKKRLVEWEQNTDSIIDEIINTHRDFETEYDTIYPYFDTGDIKKTTRALWDFCKNELVYEAETTADQSVKSPTAILQSGHCVDCKHYSLFIGGVVDAIKQQTGADYDWFYRFAGYKNGKKRIEHVFVVVVSDGAEIWVDPVLGSYNEKMQPAVYIDEKPDNMALWRISGVPGNAIGAAATQPLTITVDKRASQSDFLTMVNINLNGVRDFMRNNMDVTNTLVKQYFMQNGYDFNQLLLILQR